MATITPALAADFYTTWRDLPMASVARTCTYLAVAVLTVFAAACSDDDRSSSAAGVEVRPAADCSEDDLDVASEPSNWRQESYRQWFRDGCLVRIDVITDRAGPDHCGWGGTRVIAVGTQIGLRITSEADTTQFVRDPSNAYRVGLNVGFDATSTLPTAAKFSGYQSASEELWLVPGDDQYVYLVSGERVERWPAGEPPLCS